MRQNRVLSSIILQSARSTCRASTKTFPENKNIFKSGENLYLIQNALKSIFLRENKFICPKFPIM